jgi:pyroglutamyl-peptidase
MPVRVILTGFGVFHGVSDNPSERLARWLKQQYDSGQVAFEGCCSLEVAVLEVSARAADSYIAQLGKQLEDQHSAHDRILLVHMGVDGKRGQYSLECRAYNNADFRVADEAGFHPHQQCIDSTDGKTVDCCLCTSLDLTTLQGTLQAKGYVANVSQSAGRFVCNYIMYRSLQMVASLPCSQRCGSMFLHVPSFKVFPEEQQRCFLVDFLKAICKQVCAAEP